MQTIVFRNTICPCLLTKTVKILDQNEDFHGPDCRQPWKADSQDEAFYVGVARWPTLRAMTKRLASISDTVGTSEGRYGLTSGSICMSRSVQVVADKHQSLRRVKQRSSSPGVSELKVSSRVHGSRCGCAHALSQAGQLTAGLWFAGEQQELASHVRSNRETLG